MVRPVTLTRNDWSLHRKGPVDAARHAEKVKEAIRDNLPHIVSDESIITSDGQKIVKVPVRSLELPRFRYDFGRNRHIGQGDGDSQAGDTVDGQQQAPGKGKQAGDGPGVDYVEAFVTMDDLSAVLFEDLTLPYLENKQAEILETEKMQFNEVARKGIMANLDKRRTILQNIKRNAMLGRARFADIKNDDLRFKIWVPEMKRETNAVIIAMRDVSGSMGEFEKYISRSFYFWMVRFLRTRYKEVEIVFITHHTEAKEVDEETFFSLGESGGTKVSSAYQLALDVIEQRFNPAQWNVYPFHFSDGDNWGDTDNRRCVDLVGRMLEAANVFGYGEIREGGARSTSTLMSAFAGIQEPRFVSVVITDRNEVYPALRRFFSPVPVSGPSDTAATTAAGAS